MDTLYKLVENGVLELGNVFESCIRWLGWGIINLLAKLVNGIEDVTSDVYTLNGFFNSSEVTQLIDKYKPIVWTILGISIGILGFKIIFNRQQNRNELPSNILFSILVVMLLSTFMTKMNDITKLAITSAKNTSQSITNSLVKESLYDIYYLDTKEFDLEGDTNNISADNLYNIDINEELKTNEVSNSELFKKKIEFDDNGDKKLVELEKGWFKADEKYYRYNIDFIPVIISLGAIAIAFVCIILKVVRLMFELAFNKFFATLLAFADISDGRKLKEMIKHIISIFIVLFITAILTNMYLLYNSWLTTSLIANGLGGSGILKIMMIIGGAVAVVDGPNLVERILGIDAGLKSAWGTVMAGYGATKGALNAGKGIFSGMSKLGNGLALGMAGVGGAMAGMFGNKDKSNADKSNNPDSNNQDDSTNNNLDEVKNKDKSEKTLQEEMNLNKDDKNKEKKDFNRETLQDQMKASKNNEANLKNLNDKFKEIEDLKNNPNKDLKKNNSNNDKDSNLDGKTLQEEMKANINNSDKVKGKENVNPKTGNNINQENISKGIKDNTSINSGEGSGKEVNGKMENRTFGEYIKDGVQKSKFVDNVNRAYTLGYNTTSKWDIKGKNKEKKGEKK